MPLVMLHQGVRQHTCTLAATGLTAAVIQEQDLGNLTEQAKQQILAKSSVGLKPASTFKYSRFDTAGCPRVLSQTLLSSTSSFSLYTAMLRQP
jgi:hypothetical protein